MSIRTGRDLDWTGEIRIFGESLNEGVRLQVLSLDAVQKLTIAN
jgi:hypothetical protein